MSVLTPSVEILPTAIQVAICLCHHKNSFLLLLRNPQKPFGLLWCAPGGKLLLSESPHSGAVRELREETSIQASPNELTSLGSYLMSYEGDLYQLHLFVLPLQNKEERIHLSYEEHIAFTWIEIAQIGTLEFVPGLLELLEISINYINGSSELSS